MVYCKCIEEIRDGNIIDAYKLSDSQGNCRVLDKNTLKLEIQRGNLTVVNLKLTKNGRIIHRSKVEEYQMMKLNKYLLN